MIKFLSKDDFIDFSLDEYYELLNNDQYFIDKVNSITKWIDNSDVCQVPDVSDQTEEFIFESLTEDL